MPPKSVRRGAAAAGGTASRQSTSQAASTTPTGSASSTPQPSTASGTAGAPSTRAPVQRLQTLKKHTPSGSIGPAARTPAATTPGNGGPAKPTLKYKPRAVGRRSKEERDAIEKLEAERNRERLAEVAAMRRGRGNAQRGRGGPGRGRGGPLGGGRRGRGGRFETDSRASSMSRSRSVIDIGSGAASRHVSSDESDPEILPIDHIELESDEDLDLVADTKKGKVPLRHADREKGLRPVRVERHEHVERVVSVNMESSTSKPAEAEAKYEDEVEESHAKKTRPEDDSLFVRDDDVIEPQVKEEPVDEDHTMTDAVPHVGEAATHDDGFLPAQKVKVRRRLSPKTPEPEPAPVLPSKPAVAKDPRSLLRTKEDIEEYERHARDLEAILELLSVEPKESRAERLEPAEGSTEAPQTAVSDQEKEEKAEDAEEDETKDKLAGQLFLMQFPPMTPNLIVPGIDSGSTEGAATEDTQAVPSGTRSGEAAVKVETGEVEILDGAEGTTSKAPSKILTAAGWQLSAGRVGKLNVHKSGRVTMDWGGISFELDRATPVDFLQEALIVSAPEEGTPEEENRVWAMGQLSGKFTVTPDWQKML